MIGGSRIGKHPILQGREDGYVAPGRRAYSERAKRSHSHGFQILEDPILVLYCGDQRLLALSAAV